VELVSVAWAGMAAMGAADWGVAPMAAAAQVAAMATEVEERAALTS
jgi:hypothetical protein